MSSLRYSLYICVCSSTGRKAVPSEGMDDKEYDHIFGSLKKYNVPPPPSSASVNDSPFAISHDNVSELSGGDMDGASSCQSDDLARDSNDPSVLNKEKVFLSNLRSSLDRQVMALHKDRKIANSLQVKASALQENVGRSILTRTLHKFAEPSKSQGQTHKLDFENFALALRSFSLPGAPPLRSSFLRVLFNRCIDNPTSVPPTSHVRIHIYYHFARNNNM